MGKAPSAITIILILAVVVALPLGSSASVFLAAAAPPNSPYTGTGNALNIQEFARNDSTSFPNATKDSAFSYLGSWYPTGYQGYRLRADVSNVRTTADPIPNGDFEQFSEPGNNWTLVDRGTPVLVNSIGNVTGGNPGYCLDVVLRNNKVNGASIARIENDFSYTSSYQPLSLVLGFDIKFSIDITPATWLWVNVSVVYLGSIIGNWSMNTGSSPPMSWEHHSFGTTAVNGSVILRITIQKTNTGNPSVDGHIYFDNFRYTISSTPPPSKVGLELNGTAFVDSSGNAGTANIYADPILKERASAVNCWSTTRQFQFSATRTVTFNYNYSMSIKKENAGTASTFFSAPADASPTWVANYTIASGRPPSGHTGYNYAAYLPTGWSLSSVRNSTGQNYPYSYNATTGFVKLADIINPVGKTFSISASSSNHILQVYLQRGPTSSGPWINITSADFLVTGDFLRALAQLGPIEGTGNSANISVFFPNSTLWRSDAAPAFDTNLDTLTSAAWQMPTITEATAGDDWLVTISFNTETQCGMRTQSFTAYIEPKGSVVSPPAGSRYLWGSVATLNVTWRNNASLAYVVGGTVQVRYIDRYSVPQYASMIGNGQGAYSWSISTSLLKPNRTAEFDVEFRKAGYVNATYSQGTHLPVVFNLVNDIDYHMVRPVQSTGPNEYTGETSLSIGFVTQVRLFDFFESLYARNDTSPWSGAIRLNCTRYEDTGSGWVPAGAGNFLPNGGDPTLFEKTDANYSAGLLRVKYVATARFVGGFCDYQQQNFTVIIEMVAFATDLDAVRTVVAHPPSGTGDGWILFNQGFDDYEVHLYAGELLNLTVYYENVSALPSPISDGSVDLLVLGSWLPLGNRGNGYYNYTLNTLALDIGSTQLEVNASRADCASQVIVIHLVIAPRPCELKPTSLVVDVVWGDAFGVMAYYNDTLGNQPITGAAVQYQWGIASGTLSPTGLPGWYNVSLATVTHATGQEPLTLTVSYGKYKDCVVIVSVRIAARPTYLTTDAIQTYYPTANITVSFPTTRTQFSVPVTDLFIVRLRFADANGSLIADATGLFSGDLGTHYLLYADGFYVLQLDLSGVASNTYHCSISFTRQNYVSKSLPQWQLDVTLVPTRISGISSTIAQITGQPFGIKVYLNDTYHNLGVVGANVTIDIPDLGVSAQLADLGNGSYSLDSLVYSVTGFFATHITARAGSWYLDATFDATLVLSAGAGGNPLLTLAVLIIAVAAIALLSSFIAYTKLLRPRVLHPRRVMHEQKLQDVADMFGDVNNLSRFLVLHRGSGIAIFDPFSERGMDAAIFGGFLQAISAFAVDVARTTEDDQLPVASPLHEISYEGFRVLIHDGRFVRTALVFKGKPSDKLKRKMEEFTTRFEAKYFKELGEWCCEPELFADASILLEEIFHVSLLLPHKVQPKVPETRPLADMESKLYGIALALTQLHDTILLQEVAKAYTTAFKADQLEVLSALYQLREKKLLVPIEFYQLTKKAREQLAAESKVPGKGKTG